MTETEQDNILDEMALLMLYINQTQTGSAWKGLPWDCLNRLHDADLISNPVKKTKSVYLMPEALKKAEEIYKKYLGES